MPNKTVAVMLDGKLEELTGEISLEYAGKTWLVAHSSFGPELGPNGEIGYSLQVHAYLLGQPMPEGLMDEYRLAPGMPDETTQGSDDTSNVPIQT